MSYTENGGDRLLAITWYVRLSILPPKKDKEKAGNNKNVISGNLCLVFNKG